MTKKMALGGPLTRPECDKCMDLLAAAGLPRASTNQGAAHTMLNLYFSLLSETGITGKMLLSACKAYIMRPNNGKSKYFPDPGQLAEMCAEDLRIRRQEIAALDEAERLLVSPPPVECESDQAGRRASLHALGEQLDALKVPPPKMPSTAREETPETLNNLREIAERRIKEKAA